MTHTESVAVMAQATFGRDSAMFESLLVFVAQLSLVLWGLVILTVVIRFVGIWIYRRGAARTALAEAVAPIAAVPVAVVPATVVPSAAVPATMTEIDLVQPATGQLNDAVTNAAFDGAPQQAEAPAAVAASVMVPHHAPFNRRAEHRSAAHVHALAANSTEG